MKKMVSRDDIEKTMSDLKWIKSTFINYENPKDATESMSTIVYRASDRSIKLIESLCYICSYVANANYKMQEDLKAISDFLKDIEKENE